MTNQSLYEVLGVEKNATQAEIKKAYRQRALQLHPDKNPNNEDAKAKFQLLQKVYAILGDEGKRKVYDETGSTDDDDLAGAGFDGLVDYFRAMFAIKTEDIDDFAARYQGGEEERSDLLRYYSQFRGRMAHVFDHLMCSDPDVDSHRLMDLINGAIEAGEVERHKSYTSWAKQVAAKPRPAARVRSASGAGASGSGAGGGPSNALVAAIQAKRAAAANSFFDSLAAKYGGGSGAGKGGKGKSSKAKGAGEPSSEPTDEEFEAARQRMVAKQQQQQSGGGGGSKKAGGKKGRVVVVDDDEEDDSDEDMEEVEADGSDEDSMDVSDEEEAAKPQAKKAGGGAGAKRGVKKAKGKDTARGSDQRGSVKAKAKSSDAAEEKENKAAAENAGATGKGKGKSGNGVKAGEKRRKEQEVQPTKKAKRAAA